MAAACAVLGHRFAFTADDATMSWRCRRCAEGGSKTYASAADAARYAAAFDPSGPGRPAGSTRMTPLSLLPLQLARRLAGRRRESR